MESCVTLTAHIVKYFPIVFSFFSSAGFQSCLKALQGKFGPKSNRVRRLTGMFHEASGDFVEAGKTYDLILTDDPNNVVRLLSHQLLQSLSLIFLFSLARGKEEDCAAEGAGTNSRGYQGTEHFPGHLHERRGGLEGTHGSLPLSANV